jgi:mannose-6-phosphate isomerase-like protein (cupin superfamily)
MRATVTELRSRIPGPVAAGWPDGEPFALAFAHGSMSVEFYAPVGSDPQTPHDQDELYFIHQGSGEFVIAGLRHAFGPGDCFFVAAAVEHRFTRFTEGFGTWVVFWGPKGGERA